jgi:hypothetical protein
MTNKIKKAILVLISPEINGERRGKEKAEKD